MEGTFLVKWTWCNWNGSNRVFHWTRFNVLWSKDSTDRPGISGPKGCDHSCAITACFKKISWLWGKKNLKNIHANLPMKYMIIEAMIVSIIVSWYLQLMYYSNSNGNSLLFNPFSYLNEVSGNIPIFQMETETQEWGGS